MCKEYANYQTGEILDLEKVSQLKDNAMLKVKPELWIIWNFKKNNELSLSIWDMTKGIKKKAWWYCDECDDSYSQSIESKSRGTGCSFCNGKLVNARNCIATTNPKIASYMLDSKDGYKYTQFSEFKVNWKCPDCDNVILNKAIKAVSLYGLSCPRCSDGIKYPEKMVYNVLREMKLPFFFQKKFKWIPNKIYDFYFELDNKKYIIETHGGQHYYDGFVSLSGQDCKEVQENDRIKENTAKINNIDNYIVIDCRKSDFNFIRNNIEKSAISLLPSFSEIDWNRVYENTESSLSKEIIYIYENITTNIDSMMELLNLSRNMILKTLRRWHRLDKVYLKHSNIKRKVVQLSKDYVFIKTWISVSEVRKEFKNVSKVLQGEREFDGGYRFIYYENYVEYKDNLSSFPFYINKNIKKRVVQLTKDSRYIKTWNSIKEACDSVGLANQSSISSVCLGKKKSAKGFKWMYLSDYESFLENQNKTS